MPDSLFEFQPSESFPEGITNLELNDLQRVVLKLLAFIDHPRSLSEIKQLAGDIITSVPKYLKVKKSTVSACIDFFDDHGFFISYDRGIALHREVVRKLLPLADSHLQLINIAYNVEKNLGYRSKEEARLKLAILSRDISIVNEEFSATRYYYSRSTTERLWEALLDFGDLALISPILPELEDTYRNDILIKIPYYLPYHYFKQWDSVLLNQKSNLCQDTDFYEKADPYEETDIFEDAVYNYLSCAHLILPRQQVVDISERLDANPNSLFFSELLKGNTQTAWLMASSWLQTLQEKNGHRRKELPGAFGILYAIVLLASGEPGSTQMAATFVRNAKKQLPEFSNDNNPFKQFADILLMFRNHRIGNNQVNWRTIYDGYQSPFHQQLLTVVLSWMGHPLKDANIPLYVSEKEEMEYRASGLKFESETDENSEKRLKELEEKLNAIPLARLLGAEEPWEILLSVLSQSDKKTKTKKTEKESRLIWIVDPLDEYSLEVFEQTKNKAGWSKAKQRSLAGLQRKMPDLATPQDISVINSLPNNYRYASITAKKWEELLEALSVHPHVYTDPVQLLPLEIRVQQAQIQIDKKGEGASIKLNPSSPDDRVVMETPTRYIYTKWSPRAIRIYQLLAEQGDNSITIPADGMKKARPVLDSLGKVMPVTGNFATTAAKIIRSANNPVLQLTPVNDRLHVQLLIEISKDEDTLLVPGIGSSEILVETADNRKFNIQRNREKEKEIKTELADRISWLQELKDSSAQLFIDDDRDILDFLSELKEKAPEVKLIWPKGERLRVVRVISYADISINIKQDQNWFEIDGEVNIDSKLKLSVQQLLDKSQGGTLKYVQLDDKTFLTIQKDLQKRLSSLNIVANIKGKKLEVHPLGVRTVESLLTDIPLVKTDKHWKEHIEKLNRLRSYQPSLPSNLQAQLRPYQVEGILWLDRLHEWGVGGCLADDMGLGKTIQALSIMLKYAQDGPGLVIAPSSVCANWEKEITRFAPTLKPQVLKNQNRGTTLKKLSGYDVLIVSYGIIQSNPDLLSTREWNIVVLDEAHAIKNSKSVRSRAVMKLKANFRILTTGTPIQNHLGELWNLFQFMNPGMLGSQEQFIKKYSNGNGSSQNKKNRSALNHYIAPFILRRNKSDVLDDLPGKTEITLHITLSEEERAMYEILREKAIEQITGSDHAGGARHMQILSEITKLRLMSCNPLLIAPDSKVPSSKLEALETLVNDLLNANHKALIFSQFTKYLALIREMLDNKGLSYQYLDGATPVKKRELIVQDFQNGKSDLFLISLKAGGHGLNLTAADYVIHMDPWWNPAVEDQASDRSHRIGQKRPVTIYRLIAENTIEEKIVKLHHEKRDLADKLLADTDQSAKISSEELFNLIVENN